MLAITIRLQERAVEERFITAALALTVERDLRTIEAALEVLARSSWLDTGDWNAFSHHAITLEILREAPRLEAAGGVSDVDVSTRGFAPHGAAVGHERDSGAAEE